MIWKLVLKAKKLTHEDFARIQPHDFAKWELDHVRTQAHGDTSAIFEHDGYACYIEDQIVLIGGFVEWIKDRAILWGVIDKRINDHAMIHIHRYVKGLIEDSMRFKYIQVQMTVRADFPPAIRWAEMLGFNRICELKEYDPKGNDHFLYSRAKQ